MQNKMLVFFFLLKHTVVYFNNSLKTKLLFNNTNENKLSTKLIFA